MYPQSMIKNKKTIPIFPLKNVVFYSREILLYTAWACLGNDDSLTSSKHHHKTIKINLNAIMKQ